MNSSPVVLMQVLDDGMTYMIFNSKQDITLLEWDDERDERLTAEQKRLIEQLKYGVRKVLVM
jgi:hypothetical protein